MGGREVCGRAPSEGKAGGSRLRLPAGPRCTVQGANAVDFALPSGKGGLETLERWEGWRGAVLPSLGLAYCLRSGSRCGGGRAVPAPPSFKWVLGSL